MFGDGYGSALKALGQEVGEVHMMKWVLVVSLAMIVGSQSGCMTIFGNFVNAGIDGHPETRIYGGVRLHVDGWGFENMSTLEIMFYWIVALIDIPLCFVADTVTLPITIPMELSR